MSSEMTEEAKHDDTFQVEAAAEALDESQIPDDSMKNLINELFSNAEEPIDPKVVDQLSEGLLSRFMPTLTKTQSELLELTENQRIQIETLLQENAKFSESSDLKEVKTMMDKGKLYHEKLIKIKKEMHQLHEKSTKLKKRAIALQQQRQRQDLQDEHQRELQAAHERELLAKPAKLT